ncbi:MAG: SufD family Fe-S cluster assembly protein [Clostridia bacterium]|nr:SufD family Fe-S cluster assembly protein [Clostridia bacterium]
MLKVNRTPVRTSRNFKINNIKLEDVNIPEKVWSFKPATITSSNLVENNVAVSGLTYGLGDSLLKNVMQCANHKAKITVDKQDKDIKMIYHFDDENTNLINYIEIDAKENANVIVEYKSNTEKECFVNSIIKIVACQQVMINVFVINLLNESSNFFLAMENSLEENSNLQYTVIDLGAKNSIQNYYANMTGESANNDLQAIYLGRKNQLKDINYIAELRGQKTNVNIDVQGALKDNAKKNFKGTIDFKKGCKKAKGDENEYCMLLSDRAKSIALPMLLCTEDDVEGNHSTASGKLNEKEIFYIMSRGINKQEATKLIIKARFQKILERICDEEVRNELMEEIDRRLD